MPYIPKERRAALDTIIDGLVKRTRSLDPVRGDLNYIVTRLVLESLRPGKGWSYHSLSDCVSVLRDAADEITRRLLGPYEDTAIKKNGDMFCFSMEPFASSLEPGCESPFCECRGKIPTPDPMKLADPFASDKPMPTLDEAAKQIFEDTFEPFIVDSDLPMVKEVAEELAEKLAQQQIEEAKKRG